ncbi:MAG: exonuclease SbcCD subunit D [Planctomycetota bacterium]
MRILHTADWHLGRVLGGLDLIPAQRHAIDGLIAIAADARPDAIVVAGDLYDRAVPGEEAVGLLDEALRRLGEIAPVLAIAGNHDSGARLDFGGAFFRRAGVHLVGTPRGGPVRVDLADEHGRVSFHLLPYATPAEIRFVTGDERVHTHDDATRARIAALDTADGARHVLVGHLFVQGGAETTESERDISVGGIATVDPAMFARFHYTALGHLHRPHALADGRVRYAGSLARYSFAEEHQPKTVSLVALDGTGAVTVEAIDIPQRHAMRSLRGTLAELLAAAATDAARQHDLIRATLTDPLPPAGARERLAECYPHLLEFRYESFERRPGATAGPAAGDLATRSPHDFVVAFLADRYPGVADDAVTRLARECMEAAIAAGGPR